MYLIIFTDEIYWTNEITDEDKIDAKDATWCRIVDCKTKKYWQDGQWHDVMESVVDNIEGDADDDNHADNYDKEIAIKAIIKFTEEQNKISNDTITVTRPVGMRENDPVICSWSNTNGFGFAKFDARIPGTNDVKIPEDVKLDTLEVFINGLSMQFGFDYILSDTSIIFDKTNSIDATTSVNLRWLSESIVYGGNTIIMDESNKITMEESNGEKK
jgi:hypothetical protein